MANKNQNAKDRRKIDNIYYMQIIFNTRFIFGSCSTKNLNVSVKKILR